MDQSKSPNTLGLTAPRLFVGEHEVTPMPDRTSTEGPWARWSLNLHGHLLVIEVRRIPLTKWTKVTSKAKQSKKGGRQSDGYTFGDEYYGIFAEKLRLGPCPSMIATIREAESILQER